METKCKECLADFKSVASLNKHIKCHGITLPDYYVKHYARKNLLTGELLPFKDAYSYFEHDFVNAQQMNKWCRENSPEIVKPYILNKLIKRKEEKELKYAPPSLELKISRMPSVEIYRQHFGSYGKAAKAAGLDFWYKDSLPKDFDIVPELEILVDTREQKPLFFKKSSVLKLDLGDYGIGGEHYNYTFVDRKSESDFKGTMTLGNERFRAEMQRARDFGCFIFVVIECSISDIYAHNNFKNFHKANIEFIWHQMKELQRDYMDCCQFIFAESREKAGILIPKLLYHGKKLWKCDMQYFLENKL